LVFYKFISDKLAGDEPVGRISVAAMIHEIENTRAKSSGIGCCPGPELSETGAEPALI